MSFIIGVDFDGTVVEHKFPAIGKPVPQALEWLRRFQEAGAKLVLWTMRSNGPQKDRLVLSEAICYLRSNSIELWGINENPEQSKWTSSPKAYCHIYIDDAAAGCPLVEVAGERPYVDWNIVGPSVMRQIKANA